MSAFGLQNNHEAQEFKVCPGEHFDYRCIYRFKNLCIETLSVDARVIVDLVHTLYIDSSGLALLQCMSHWIDAPNVSVEVINCSEDMRYILSRSRLSDDILIS